MVENVEIIRKFYQFMKNSGAGDKHINNNLKIVLSFASFNGQDFSFKDIGKQQIIRFLDSKIKSIEQDPDKRWITTWNVYLNHLKYFFRWLYNEYLNEIKSKVESNSQVDWITPDFMKIKTRRTKRIWVWHGYVSL